MPRLATVLISAGAIYVLALLALQIILPIAWGDPPNAWAMH